MKHLLSRGQRSKISGLLKGRRPLLLLDFDGTLVRLYPTPERTRVSPGLKKLLAGLAKKYGRLVIVSGRGVRELKKKIGLPQLDYVGNHGLEIVCRGRPRAVTAGVKKYLGPIRRVKKILAQKLRFCPGIFLQDKKITLSVHYRLVPRRYEARVEKMVREALKPFLGKKLLRLGSGKKVWEISPALPVDKGTAVSRVLKAAKAAAGRDVRPVWPVYIGDDKTDEDAFRALGRRGLTVLVGRPRPSRAGYFLKDPAEVVKFLKILLKRSDG